MLLTLQTDVDVVIQYKNEKILLTWHTEFKIFVTYIEMSETSTSILSLLVPSHDVFDGWEHS